MACVSNIDISNVIFTGTLAGARIKTWPVSFASLVTDYSSSFEVDWGFRKLFVQSSSEHNCDISNIILPSCPLVLYGSTKLGALS